MAGRKTSDKQSRRECAMCGKAIREKGPNIKKRFDGSQYSFDSTSCLLIFRKLRDVYGKKFFKP